MTGIMDATPPYDITHYINPAIKSYIIDTFRNGGYPNFSEAEADDIVEWEPQYDSTLKSYNEEHAENPIKKEYLVIDKRTKEPVDEKRYSDYKEVEDAVNVLWRKWFQDKKETAVGNIANVLTANDVGRSFEVTETNNPLSGERVKNIKEE